MIPHEIVQHFVTRFISRRDDYALQQPTGRYLRANRPLMQTMLRRHFDGVETVGTYVIDERGMCRYAVFDADSANGLDVLLLLSWQLVEEGIPSYLEQSRRGGHLWVLLDGLYPASVVRRWLLPFCPAGVELYLSKMRAAAMARSFACRWGCICGRAVAIRSWPGLTRKDT